MSESGDALTDSIAFRDRAVYLRESGTLVLADLHVGRARASNVSFPLGERADLVGRLRSLLERFSPETVVFAGDVLHAFDRLPRTVERTVDALVAAVADADASLVVTPGNHDAMLDSVYDGASVGSHRLADAVVSHGHEEPAATGARYVIGHEHPAIRIEGRKYPCYLHGAGVYRGSDVLVLPAFSRIARGTVVNRQRNADCLSPLVRTAGLGSFRPIVRDEDDDETLVFPSLRTFRPFL